MTRREPQTAVVSEAHAGLAEDSLMPRRIAGQAASPPDAAPPWMDLYRFLSLQQRQELLHLAVQQGVLYANQLPPVPRSDTRPDDSRLLLQRILSGHTHDLSPLQPSTDGPMAKDLDPIQRDAVARALQTPDLFLLHGGPGTGKSRVLAEIIVGAVARGERVLLVAPTTAPLDRVLELAAEREGVFALRSLDKQEQADALPPTIHALTAAGRARALREQTLPAARQRWEQIHAYCLHLRQDEATWKQLRELADERMKLASEQASLLLRVNQAADEVKARAEHALSSDGPADAFVKALYDRHQVFQSRLAEIDQTLASHEKTARHHQQELEQAAEHCTKLQPYVDARQGQRWWTPAYWKAVFQSNLVQDGEAADQSRQQAQKALEALLPQVENLKQARQDAERDFKNDWQRQLDDELARLQNELHSLLAAADKRRSHVDTRWQMLCQSLAFGAPAELTAEAITTGESAWQVELTRNERELAFASQWVACLEKECAAGGSFSPECFNVVASTTGAFSSETNGKAPRDDKPFDYLILEDADLVTESEFLALSRRARRWILVGDPQSEMTREAKKEPPRTTPRRGGPGRAAPMPAATLRPGFFQRIWHVLHCDPRCLPYAWYREKDRLCCRLRHVSAEQRHQLQAEPLADFTDIELRILPLPRGQSELAEVVFPAGMSLEQAKKHIYCELQELTVRATSGSIRWIEEAEHLSLSLSDSACKQERFFELEPGLRELVAVPGTQQGDLSNPALWHTCRVEFARSAGWDRPKAEAWIQLHLGLRDLGRTARLERPHRFEPALAMFLHDVLGCASPEAAGISDPSRNGFLAPVEFIPVPALREERARGRGERPSRASEVSATALLAKLHGGAGLELDMTDPRHRERVPAEWRAGLPPYGFVNYLEAQAVTRLVTNLLSPRGAADGPRPRVAVIALYTAQAELIRCMLRQAPIPPGSVEVDISGAFRQREADIVVVSLTRSHLHRAVAYGESPQLLACALTRARSRLLLVGDPGTLIRRSQWEGPLEQLDEAAAQSERSWVTQLVSYLQGAGPHPHVFHLRQGVSA